LIVELSTPGNGEKTGTGAKAATNWMLGPVKTWLNENNKGINDFPVTTSRLASLIGMVEDGKLNFSIAAGKIFSQLLKDPSTSAATIAKDLDLLQDSELSSLEPVIDKVLNQFADKVVEYKKGKKGLLALFVGEVMKQTKGKADPGITNVLLLEKLKS